MNELEKLRNGQLAKIDCEEIQAIFSKVKPLLAKLSSMSMYTPNYRETLEEIVPHLPKNSMICPPFYCDYGNGIRLGEHVYVNADCTFLDGGYITIGSHTLIGPKVQLYTPHHPIDHIERRSGKEYGLPITIGKDCWIGGGVIVCPGVTIGDCCIIGAGSVVTHNIPPHSMAVGNPAKVIKQI